MCGCWDGDGDEVEGLEGVVEGLGQGSRMEE